MSTIRRVEGQQYAFEIGGQGGQGGHDVPAEPATASIPEPTKATRASVSAKTQAPTTLTGVALVKQLRARLREVEREIRARKKLEAEREQLQRLLAAATGKNNLIPLREVKRAV